MRTKTIPGLKVPLLQEWREWALLDQQMLAKEAGISPSTVSYIEHGQKPALFSTIKKLAKALQITPQQLLYEHPPKP